MSDEEIVKEVVQNEWGTYHFIKYAPIMMLMLLVLVGFILKILPTESSDISQFEIADLPWIAQYIILSAFALFLVSMALSFLTAMSDWMHAVVHLLVKSTVLCWFPLAYVVYDAVDKSVPLARRLTEMRSSALARLTKRVSWIILAIFVFKLVILPEMVITWNGLFVSRLMNIYIAPEEINLQHIAAAINAIMFLLFYFLLFDKAKERVEDGIWSARRVELVITGYKIVRGIVTTYTIAVDLMLTWTATKGLNVAVINPALFPVVP